MAAPTLPESDIARIRIRPGMYLGRTDSHGLQAMLFAVLRTAFAPTANSAASTVRVVLGEDGSVEVTDTRSRESGEFADLLSCCTRTHPGQQPPADRNWFDYTVANALSEWMQVEACGLGLVEPGAPTRPSWSTAAARTPTLAGAG